MTLRLEKFSYRFTEEVLNSKISLKQRIESILSDGTIDVPSLSRLDVNDVLRELFAAKGRQSQPSAFDERDDLATKMDFLKERRELAVVGVVVRLPTVKGFLAILGDLSSAVGGEDEGKD